MLRVNITLNGVSDTQDVMGATMSAQRMASETVERIANTLRLCQIYFQSQGAHAMPILTTEEKEAWQRKFGNYSGCMQQEILRNLKRNKVFAEIWGE